MRKAFEVHCSSLAMFSFPKVLFFLLISRVESLDFNLFSGGHNTLAHSAKLQNVIVLAGTAKSVPLHGLVAKH